MDGLGEEESRGVGARRLQLCQLGLGHLSRRDFRGLLVLLLEHVVGGVRGELLREAKAPRALLPLLGLGLRQTGRRVQGLLLLRERRLLGHGLRMLLGRCWSPKRAYSAQTA